MTTRLHNPLHQVAPGVHCAEGWWKASPMGRRMTVMEVGKGRMAVHCSMSMPQEEMQRLDSLGQVTYIIAPNPAHASEAPDYARRYPQASVLVPQGMVRRQERRMTIHGTLEDGWPADLEGHLQAISVQGLRIPESAFLHVPSRTLVLTDLVMNFGPDHFKGVMKLLMSANGVIDRFGPSRLLRHGLIRDRNLLRASLQAILAWDFHGVIMNHGRILESGGQEKLRHAYRFLLDGAARPG